MLVTVARVEDLPPGTVSARGTGGKYDVGSGLNEFDHAIGLETYGVHVEDGDVRVELPARA